MATLKVTVHEARDLPIMDRASGLADPYVVIKLDDMEYTTDIVRRTRHPVWNRDYRFDTPDLLVLQEDPLEVRVYDHDIISRDDIIGIVLLDCNSIMYCASPSITGWFPLFDTSAGLQGDVRLTIRIKFHAADNPLAPTLPERYVRRLVASGPSSADATLVSSFNNNNANSANNINMMSNNSNNSMPTGSVMSPQSPGSRPQFQPSNQSAASPRGSLRETNGSRYFDSSVVLGANPNADNTAAVLPLLLEHSVEPLQAVHLHHPTLAAEEEGVFIFGVSRLDPSVFRIESTESMVEELIVKADPEHSRLTNIRSIRATNEARLVQMFKLSGKVRRQLTRKVVELKCNAVLGYVEEFDMEPNGIIVRAYGTPCVLSEVKFVDDSSLQHLLKAHPQLLRTAASHNSLLRMVSGAAGSMANNNSSLAGGGAGPSLADEPIRLPPPVLTFDERRQLAAQSVDSALTGPAGTEGTPKSGPVGSIDNTASNTPHNAPQPAVTTDFLHSPPSAGTPGGPTPGFSAPGASAPVLDFQTGAQPLIGSSSVPSPSAAPGTSTRSAVMILTVKDLPSGSILHFGGHICTRSVKIVSKVKSKMMISQERDAWWMELREELRANARAFHCNAILGYEEEAEYHEDVVMLSLFGTAVVIDLSLLPLRLGQDNLYRRTQERAQQNKGCSMLHLYTGHQRKALATEVNDWFHRSMCQHCHHKPVPEVLLASCTLPVDLTCEGPLRLVQVTVVKQKRDVKGVELAMAVSQALPFIEFALHKQLMFNLRLLQLNACFRMHVSIAVGPDSIVGSLTGTGCRLTGLPIPTLPRLKIVDPLIAKKDAVVRVKDIVARRRKLLRKRRDKHAESSSSNSSVSSRSSSRSLGSRSLSASSQARQATRTTNRQNYNSGIAASGQQSLSDDERSSLSSGDEGVGSSSNSSSDDEHGYMAPLTSFDVGSKKVNDFVVKIDDEEEAEILLGMVNETVFEDGMLLTIPYIPGQVNHFDMQERISLHRRFSVGVPSRWSTSELNECFADAKRAFVQNVCRVALRHGEVERVRVVDFRIDTFFEPYSKDLQLRLEGCLLMSTCKGEELCRQLEDAAFRECMRHINSITSLMGRSPQLALPLPQLQMIRKSSAHKLTMSGVRSSTVSSQLPSVADCSQGGGGGGGGGAGTTTASGGYAGDSSPTTSVRFSTTMESGNVDNSSSAANPSRKAARGAAAAGGGVHQVAVATVPDSDPAARRSPSARNRDLLYYRSRQLFACCNAPFTLPYVMDTDVQPMKVWSGALQDDEAAAGATAGGERGTSYTDYRTSRPTRTSTLGRQWQAFVSAAGSSFRSLVEKTKFAADGGTGRRGDARPVDALSSAPAGTAPADDSKDSRLHKPSERLPHDLNSLEDLIPTVTFTSLDFVPGQAVARYLGRLSQHFIRQEYDIDTADQLGRFYQQAEFEIQCSVQGLVRLLGGNALLKHRVVYHEVWDTDGGAFLFITVTGDVVRVTDTVRRSVMDGLFEADTVGGAVTEVSVVDEQYSPDSASLLDCSDTIQSDVQHLVS